MFRQPAPSRDGVRVSRQDHLNHGRTHANWGKACPTAGTGSHRLDPAGCGASSLAKLIPPAETSVGGLPLTQTHLVPGFGFTIGYPPGRAAASQSPVSLFAES